MASLKLSDSAFGSVGLTITENIDLAALSASLTALLGQTYQIDSLDASNVTREGLPNFDPQLNTGGLTAVGLGLVGSRLTVGAFDTFFASFETGAPLSFSGFETVAFTPQTVAPFVDPILRFDIFAGEIFDPSTLEQSLTFDATLRVFDFSAIGAGSLEVRLNTIAPGDTDLTLSGYTIIGNDGNTFLWGYEPPFEDSYYGSNTYILGEGDNTFFGGFDNADVTGGSGRDVMYGGSGDSTLQGLGGDDTLFAEGGGNLLDGGDGNDELFGGFGVDVLLGGAGNDVLFGGESFGAVGSTLDGGDGNDWLYGSRGNHELTGGAGSDRFVFANDFDIITSVQGEGGFVTVSTGVSVSDGESGTNRLMDFDPTRDLVALALDDVMLDPQSGSLSLNVGQQTGNLGESLLSFDINFNSQFDAFTVEDVGGAMALASTIYMVEQSTALIVDRQNLNQTVFNPSQEQSFDGAFELVYRSADQSQGAGYDVFEGLRIQPVTFTLDPPQGPIGGQDKFDLTALGLTDFAVGAGGADSREIVDAQGGFTTVAGTEVAVEDILFTNVEFDYLLDRLLIAEGPLEDTSDFFLDSSDPDNPVYRAMHVEYTNTDGEEFVAYIDADRNGGFDLGTDMVFFVRLDFNGSPGLDAVTDLFNPLAAGGGTGIFIFDESQYDFWLNDDYLEVIG